MRVVVICCSLVIAIAACGKKSASTADAPVGDAEVHGTCGNTKVEPGEECDVGATTTLVCDSTCHFTCGNGVVDTAVGETCDSAITTGDGACPTACDDGMACTSDVLSGSGCQAACVHAPITDSIAGDGCCPEGANSLTDDDCSPSCGNGVVEAGETCDTAITAGAGACPVSCDDSTACTTDVLMSDGTCQAACTHTTITTPTNGDGCCPAGANHNTDTDCSVSCGNGIVETGETCDTGITSGAGKCPTTCSDGNSCTTDTLSSAGTCQAACSFPPITAPKNGDGCCPAGANANNDTDCAPVCGNKVVENGEQCDDGNSDPNDGCTACMITALPPTAFRFSDLALRDPHTFVSVIGCNDVTDKNFLPFAVNDKLTASITTDTDMPPDGLLDFSPTLVFRPLAQAGTTTPMDIYVASCTAPIATTSCKPGANAKSTVTATNMTSGQCLAALANTTHPYAPAISNPSGPCFVTSPTTLTITLSGIPIVMQDARVAATYVGSPATKLTNGLLMGFITKAYADSTVLPSTLPLVGGMKLSVLLAGGTGACPTYSDMDKDNGVDGWWFYLNFPADKVPWSEN